MFRGYRRIVLAGLAGLALLCLGYAGYQQLNYTELQGYPKYEYQPARDRVPPAFAEEPPITSKPYHPNCNDPKNGDDADLCAQWAAVQAVEESNRLSRISIRITALEFAALVVSLIFTGWAAFAAQSAAVAAHKVIEHEEAGAAAEADRFNKQFEETKRSADAAFEAVEVARAANAASINASNAAKALAVRQFESSFKPWLSVKVGGPYIDESKYPLGEFKDGETIRPTTIQASIEVKNIGEMPAIIIGFFIGVKNSTDIDIGGYPRAEVWHELSRGESIFLGEGVGMYPLPGESPVAHCGAFVLTAENRNTIWNNFPPIVGKIDYEDPLGKRRQIGFAFRPIAVWTNDFQRWGGKDDNYDKPID